MMSTDTSLGTRAVPELRDAHASTRLGPYLSELWARRSYISHTARNELRHRQITTVLGGFWHLLNPALTIAVFYLIFGRLLKVNRGVEEGQFILFLTVGIFVFQFIQKATTDGAKSIVHNKGIIKAIRFPRAMLPLSSTITEVLAAGPTYLVMVVVAVLSGVGPELRWAALVPISMIVIVFAAGAAMIAARLGDMFIDTIQILPFVFRLALYASGVIFSVDAYAAGNEALLQAFTFNPFYCYVSLSRWAVMGGEFRPDLLVSGSVWAIATLTLGFLWFRAGEGRYARD